jgi:hypothetical protein
MYDQRPLICRVEAMYQTFFKTVMTEEQFIQTNLTSCQELAERFQDAKILQKIRTIRESKLHHANAACFNTEASA